MKSRRGAAPILVGRDGELSELAAGLDDATSVSGRLFLPGFANRAPSYEFLVFDFTTGAFLGAEHLLRPDIYQHGMPPCPQQPGGQYLYNPRNDLWFCNRLGVDPSS